MAKAVSNENLARFLEKCDERYAKAGEGGTDVIANPTATGTEELISLQVGETVYNVPATEITFSTEASADAIEVAGFSVANQSFKFPSGGTSGGAEVKGYSGIIFTNPQYGVRVSAIHADGSITVFEGDGGSVNVENVVRLIIAGELDGTNSRWCTPAEDSDGGGYKITYLGKGWSNYICYRNTTGSIFIEAVPTGNGFSFGAIMD